MIYLTNNLFQFVDIEGNNVTPEPAHADFFEVTKIQRRYAYKFDGDSFEGKARVNSPKAENWGVSRDVIKNVCLSPGDNDNPYLFPRRKVNGVNIIMPVFKDEAPASLESIAQRKKRNKKTAPKMQIPTTKTKPEFTPVPIVVKTLAEDTAIDPRMCEVMSIGNQSLAHFICIDRNPDGSETYGVPRSTFTVVTGDPGVGKTSNMLNLGLEIKKANPDARGLFVSAEMNRRDLVKLCQLMPAVKTEINILHASDYYSDDAAPSFTDALNAALKQGWDYILLDSIAEIQNIIRDEMGISSDKKAESVVIQMLREATEGVNERNIYPAVYAIQQMTKGGDPAGSNRLIHMITAHLHLYKDKKNGNTPCMEYKKNRQGLVNNKLYYSFGDGIVYDTERYDSEVDIAASMSVNPTGDLSVDDFMKDIFVEDDYVPNPDGTRVITSQTDTRNMDVDSVVNGIVTDTVEVGQERTIKDIYANLAVNGGDSSRITA